MDVASWLRSLGLEQYEAVLRENEVDESVLPDLTEDHLRELGFPLGARLKILKAIGALHSNKNSALPTDATTSAPPSAAPEDRAERRQMRRSGIARHRRGEGSSRAERRTHVGK